MPPPTPLHLTAWYGALQAASLPLQAHVANIVRGHQQDVLAQYAALEAAARQQQVSTIGAIALQAGLVAARAATQNVLAHIADGERLRREDMEPRKRKSTELDRHR